MQLFPHLPLYLPSILAKPVIFAPKEPFLLIFAIDEKFSPTFLFERFFSAGRITLGLIINAWKPSIDYCWTEPVHHDSHIPFCLLLGRYRSYGATIYFTLIISK